ncbi:hypothetical protein CVT25_000945 [Psilocybe cyanescens]|uniref:Uncharacterized protein n=1 Tax=Psilocybe cyanescens TaxID=93625 RepID=A0A409X8M7_PSICY|nr:hypothetical protein CVT25_000945 [Psilocybe cyanescens]
MVTGESAELKKTVELLEGQGKVPSMQVLQAKAKEQMTDEEYKEYRELLDELEKTDHDLWVTCAEIDVLVASHAITSRIGAFMSGRALNQAVHAAQVGGNIPFVVKNLAANGARAMRPRAVLFTFQQVPRN